MKKPPKDYDVEEVMDMIRFDINDFKDGWATIDSPAVTKIKRGKKIESFFVFRVGLYGASEKQFKVTVTEV